MKQSWRVVHVTTANKIATNDDHESSYYISPVVHATREDAVKEANDSILLSGNLQALVLSTSLEFGCRISHISGNIATGYWSQTYISEHQQQQIMSSVMCELANTYKPTEFGL